MITPVRFHSSMSNEDLINALNYNFGQVEKDSADSTVEKKTTKYADIVSSNFTVAGSRFSTTSTTIVDIPNATMTYKAPHYDVKVLAIYSIMAMSSPGNSSIYFTVDNVQTGQQIYVDPGSPWVRATSSASFTVEANQTVTLKMRGDTVSGSTLQVANETNNWKPSISLFIVPA